MRACLESHAWVVDLGNSDSDCEKRFPYCGNGRFGGDACETTHKVRCSATEPSYEYGIQNTAPYGDSANVHNPDLFVRGLQEESRLDAGSAASKRPVGLMSGS